MRFFVLSACEYLAKIHILYCTRAMNMVKCVKYKSHASFCMVKFRCCPIPGGTLLQLGLKVYSVFFSFSYMFDVQK